MLNLIKYLQSYILSFLFTAGLWKEYAYDVCLVGWIGIKHNWAVSYSSFLPLWACCQGKSCLFFPSQLPIVYLLAPLGLLFSSCFPQVVFDRMKGMALILYNNIEYAQAAVKDTKGWKIGGSKIKVSETKLCSLMFSVLNAWHAVKITTYHFFFFRWTLPIRKVRWLSIVRCRHLARTFETFMTFSLKEGLCSFLKE